MTDLSPPATAQYDFFIAHSGKAMPAAEELYHHLNGREGARVFLDKHSIPEGAAWPAELDRALRSSRITVVLITPTVLASFYVIEEIQRAIGLMRSFGSPLIVPVYLDGTEPDANTPYGLSGLQSITVPPGSSLQGVAEQLLDVSKRISAAPAGVDGAAVVEPTTDLIVDTRGGSGTYSSIRRALASAGPGTRIHIRPGLYEEALTITQPITLIGDGPVESIILQSFNATTITLASAEATIEGITVRQQGGTFSYQAIDVAAGMPTIRRCVITGGTRSCIRARGTSTPVIDLNVITGTAAVGIELGDFASAQIENNWIYAVAETGLWIGGRAHPIVKQNVLEGCVVQGVKLEDEARVAFVANDVRECGRGVVVTGRAYITASFNNVTDSRSEGITFTDESDGTVFENRVTESGHAQVLLQTTGSPSFENNTISFGRADGVLLEQRPSRTEPPMFTRNAITDNQWSGVFVRNQAIGKFRENLVSRNRDNGFTIHDGAAGDYESNVVTENGQNGVSLHDAGPAELILNRIRANSWAGIYVSASAPRCDRNHVLENPWGAISITNGAAPRLKENDLSAPGNAAVLVQDSEGSWVSLNRIHSSVIGLDVRRGTVTVSSNTIDDNGTGVVLSPTARLTFEQNSLAGNTTPYEDATDRIRDVASNHVVETIDDDARRQRTPVFLHRLDALDAAAWGASAARGRSGGAPTADEGLARPYSAAGSAPEPAVPATPASGSRAGG